MTNYEQRSWRKAKTKKIQDTRSALSECFSSFRIFSSLSSVDDLIEMYNTEIRICHLSCFWKYFLYKFKVGKVSLMHKYFIFFGQDAITEQEDYKKRYTETNHGRIILTLTTCSLEKKNVHRCSLSTDKKNKFFELIL